MSKLAGYDFAAWCAARQRDHEAKMASFGRFLARYENYNAAIRSGDRAFAESILAEHKEEAKRQEAEQRAMGRPERESAPRWSVAAADAGSR